MTPAPRLTLASQSAVRASLLRAAKIEFDTASSGVDEDAVKARMASASAYDIAAALADEKALAVSRGTDGLVIGADQTLEFKGRLFDKTRTLDEARERLITLRGATHHLHSAVAVARGETILWRTVSTASLAVRDFSDAWLDGYLQRNGDEILSSVGCYQLEAEGLQLFDAIEGDYFAILGLPMLSLLACLRREGAGPS